MQKNFVPETILQEVLKCLEKYVALLQLGKYNEIHNEYMNNLYLKNVKKPYLYKGKTIVAEITGINENGMLQLKTDNKQIIADLKEIEFLIND
jgi:BirA family biotin operon repressor/biotin-[acetyl-CoA-carboxylase] ligase